MSSKKLVRTVHWRTRVAKTTKKSEMKLIDMQVFFVLGFIQVRTQQNALTGLAFLGKSFL